MHHGSQSLKGGPTDACSSACKDTHEPTVLLICVGNVVFCDLRSANHFDVEKETAKVIARTADEKMRKW